MAAHAADEAVWRELDEKSTRVRWFCARWIAGLAVAIAIGTAACAHPLHPRSSPHPHPSSSSSSSAAQQPALAMLPPMWATLMWLYTWAAKGVWDVVEDAMGGQPPPHRRGLVQGLCFAAVLPGCLLAATQPLFALLYTAMVLGSLLAGGIDTRVWRLAAAAVGAGAAVGLWRMLAPMSASAAASASGSGLVVSIRDLQMLLVGVGVHAVLDALQDRILDHVGRQHLPALVFVLLRLKLLPMLATGLVLLLVAARSPLAVAGFLFALGSPHFVVYDVSKILFCCWVLSTSNNDTNNNPDNLPTSKSGGEDAPPNHRHQGPSPAPAGPVSGLLRRLLIKTSVELGSPASVCGVDFLTRRSQAARCQQVLQHSVCKGAGVERYIALPSWAPLVPVESIDGPAWVAMRAAVGRILRETGGGSGWPDAVAVMSAHLHQDQQPQQRIHCQQHQDKQQLSGEDSESLLSLPRLRLILAETLHAQLFADAGPPEGQENDACLAPGDAALWVAAAESWSARVAVKGWGSQRVQRAAMARCAQLTARSPRLQQALSGLSDPDLRVSAVLQPFLLSPLINIPDGLCGVAAMLCAAPPTMEALDELGAKAKSARQLCLEALERFPPFPLLERVTADGRHVVIESDRIALGTVGLDAAGDGGNGAWYSCSEHGRRPAQSPNPAQCSPSATESAPPVQHSWLAFGCGPRACPGQALALALMAALVQQAVVPALTAAAAASGCRHDDDLQCGSDGGQAKAAAAYRAAVRRTLGSFFAHNPVSGRTNDVASAHSAPGEIGSPGAAALPASVSYTVWTIVRGMSRALLDAVAGPAPTPDLG